MPCQSDGSRAGPGGIDITRLRSADDILISHSTQREGCLPRASRHGSAGVGPSRAPGTKGAGLVQRHYRSRKARRAIAGPFSCRDQVPARPERAAIREMARKLQLGVRGRRRRTVSGQQHRRLRHGADGSRSITIAVIRVKLGTAGGKRRADHGLPSGPASRSTPHTPFRPPRPSSACRAARSSRYRRN